MKLTDQEALSLDILLHQEIKRLAKYPAGIDDKNRKNSTAIYNGIINKICDNYPKVAAFEQLNR